MHHFEGQLIAKGFRFAIIVGRFNHAITQLLLEGALDCLKRHGANENEIAVIWVPGAFELPLTAKKAAESGKFDAVICIGAIIRGATSHYDYVCAQTSSGIMNAQLQTGIPIIFAVLTTDNIEQAQERAGTKAGNLGFNYALSAIEMVNVIQSIEQKL